MDRIVVGVDGSPGAQDALQWAVGEATMRGASLEVVAAWTYLPIAAWMGDAVVLEGVEEEIERETRRLAEQAVARAVGERGNVVVRLHVVRDTAAHALLEAAKDAVLLVVGSRGMGGFKGLLLGSVSHQCVHHAPCPVVVIPPSERSRTKG